MASWPGTLPDAQVSGYVEERQSAVIRTQMDAGPEFVRRRYTAAPINAGTSLTLTAAQVTTLQAFYADTLNEGAAEFTWEHPRTGDSVSMRFRAPPQIQAVDGVTFTAQLQLEILP